MDRKIIIAFCSCFILLSGCQRVEYKVKDVVVDEYLDEGGAYEVDKLSYVDNISEDIEGNEFVEEEGLFFEDPRFDASDSDSEEISYRPIPDFNNGLVNDVTFGFDSNVLTEEAKSIARMHVEYLESNPALNLVLEGYTDGRGSWDYNLALGWKRANAVFDYLKEIGVDQNRVLTISFGEEYPKAIGNSEKEWLQNRRVFFRYGEVGVR